MSTDRPATVFLLPGLFGDEPQLRDLRQRLAKIVSFELLSLPDVEASPSLLSDLPAIARLAVAEMQRRRPDGPISVAGFSFGASVALEAAAQLVRSGRTVRELCILDGAFHGADFRRPTGALLRLTTTPKGAWGLSRRAGQKLAERLRLAQARLSPASLLRSQPTRRAWIAHHRALALARWRPSLCLARGVVFMSSSLDPRSRRLWTELCPMLDVVALPSEHGDLLKRDSLDDIVAVLHERLVGMRDGPRRG